MKYTIYTDGGVLNNQVAKLRKPYYSFKIFDEAGELVRHGKSHKLKCPTNITNNICEYLAIIDALTTTKLKHEDVEAITVFTDSQLVVKQLSGEFKVKSDNIKIVYEDLKESISQYKIPVEVLWVTRNKIVEILGH